MDNTNINRQGGHRTLNVNPTAQTYSPSSDAPTLFYLDRIHGRHLDPFAFGGRVMVDLDRQRAARLEKLNAQYAARLPARLEAIEQLMATLAAEGWREDAALQLRARCASLEGTAETFGFSDLSRAAAVLGAQLRRLEKGPFPPTEPEIQEVSRLVGGLRVATWPPDKDPK